MDPVRDPRVDHRQNPGDKVVERDQPKTEIDRAQHFRGEQRLGEAAEDRKPEINGQINRNHRRDAAQFRSDERRDIRRTRRAGGFRDVPFEGRNRHGCPFFNWSLAAPSIRPSAA
jgi:hypothetical protein